MSKTAVGPRTNIYFSFDYFYEKWYRAKEPKKMEVSCPFGVVDKMAEKMLNNYGFDLTIKSQDNRGTIYIMELINEMA